MTDLHMLTQIPLTFQIIQFTDGNHYVIKNIEKIWLQERTPEVKSDQCLLAHGFR